MTFISIGYTFFLLIFLGIYWFLGRRSFKANERNNLAATASSSRSISFLRSKALSQQFRALLIASLIFYALQKVHENFDVSIKYQLLYIPLLLIITLINFSIGKALGTNTAPGAHATNQRLSNAAWHRAQMAWNHRRLRLLWLGIVVNVIGLISFKYLPFILSNFGIILSLPTAQESASWLDKNLIAPLGISFFTFECIAYLIDIYRGAPASDRFLQFSAYKLFFPKLISGPIVRYHQFAAELKTLQFPSTPTLAEGLWLIACGAVKKALLADQLGILVDLCFGNLQRAGSGDLWLAVVAFGLQLYLDFSGYVDIARGSAILMGFNLPENFDFPYFSSSIADFWRRWHMTLGDWIRNYLYFPLGGSRKGLTRTCYNLLIVMLITGIWHGAAWGFVVWGGVHGLALVVHRLTQALADQSEKVKRWWESWIGILVAWLLTQFMVFTSWIFFRLPNLQDASLVIQNLWGHSADIQFAQKVYVEALGMERFQIALLLVTLFASMGLVFALKRGLKLQLNWPIKLLLVPLCLFTVWLLAPEGLPFIYFDY